MLDETVSPLVIVEGRSIALILGYHLAYLGIDEKRLRGVTWHVQMEILRNLLSQRQFLQSVSTACVKRQKTEIATFMQSRLYTPLRWIGAKCLFRYIQLIISHLLLRFYFRRRCQNRLTFSLCRETLLYCIISRTTYSIKRKRFVI